MSDREALKRNLAAVLNTHNVDNNLNTPDFVLAEYLFRTLHALGAVTERLPRDEALTDPTPESEE